MNMKKLLTDILLKKAKGYSFKEKTEEYTVTDNEKKLVKCKTVTKRVQPDVSAIKALLTMEEDGDVTRMSDEQLQVEKLRLLRLLNMVDEQSPPETIEEE